MKYTLPAAVGLLLLASALSLPLPAAAQEGAGGPAVIHARWEGVIGPVTSEYTTRVLETASARGAEALLLELETPGGLDTAMREIIKDFLASEVPIIVYVHPSGARAGSAGVFITMAAHVAAMTPGTNMGAAHPVAMGGAEMDSTMTEKVTNDAAAYARSIARRRGRNEEWAEDAVRRSVSATAEEALELGIIDLVASGVEEVLLGADGTEVELPSGPRVLATREALLEEVPPSFRERMLALLADPNIAYIFMLVGIYGLIFELQNPGAIFPGVIGAAGLILAFMSFQTLPINLAGLALIVLAIILFVLEVKVPSYGMLTVGGVIAMLLGSLMLFESPEPAMQVSLEVIIPAVIFTALFFALVIGLGLRAQSARVATGSEGLVGERGIARTDLDPAGRVAVHGEIWKAESLEGRIPSGSDVEVVRVSGLRIAVRRAGTGRFETLEGPAAEGGSEQHT
ncbi:MAG: nodulation protein NfeD [bacterium]